MLPDTSGFDLQRALDELATCRPGSRRPRSFTAEPGQQDFGDIVSLPDHRRPGPDLRPPDGQDDVTLVRSTAAAGLPVHATRSSSRSSGPLGGQDRPARWGATSTPPFGYDTQGLVDFYDSGFRESGDAVRRPLHRRHECQRHDDVPEIKLYGGITAAAEMQPGDGRRRAWAAGFSPKSTSTCTIPNRTARSGCTNWPPTSSTRRSYGSPVLAPLAVFDITGRLYAKLFAFLKVDLLLFSASTRSGTSRRRSRWSTSTSPSRACRRWPTNCPAACCSLNMGKFADQRLEGNATDIAEEFHVVSSGPGKVKVWVAEPGSQRGHGPGVRRHHAGSSRWAARATTSSTSRA